MNFCFRFSTISLVGEVPDDDDDLRVEPEADEDQVEAILQNVVKRERKVKKERARDSDVDIPIETPRPRERERKKHRALDDPADVFEGGKSKLK